MTTGQIVLIVFLVVTIAAMIALYFLGKKAEKRKELKKNSMDYLEMCIEKYGSIK